MVINKDPNYEKRKQAEEKLNRSEYEQKEALIAELRKESVSILCLALMYAKNFEETGEDLTRCLINVEQNAELLQRIYNKGYEDGFDKGKRGREMGGMYRVDVYQDFQHGEFKWLETKSTFADNREDAKRIVLEYAKEKYKGMNVSVVSAN